MTLTRDRVVKAIRTPAATFALCTELGRSADIENVYLVLAAVAGGATEWFDDEMRVELHPNGADVCTVDVLVDIGDGRRERLFRPFPITIGEVAARRALDALRPRLFPLTPLAQREAIVHTTLEGDGRHDESAVVVEGAAKPSPRDRAHTIHGIQRDAVTLPFGLPLVHATVARWRPRGAAPALSTTLPFGPKPEDEPPT